MAQLNVISDVMPGGQLATERAYEAIYPEFSSVSEEELVPISIDVMGVVTTVIGVPDLDEGKRRAQRTEHDAQRLQIDLIALEPLRKDATWIETLLDDQIAVRRERIAVKRERPFTTLGALAEQERSQAEPVQENAQRGGRRGGGRPEPECVNAPETVRC